MNKLKKILLCPYFGEFPPWMDKFQPPEGYDIIIDTDLPKFKQRVQDKLGIECPIVAGTGKVHDYRCALGLLYEEEIKEFDFWGTIDFDMCFGDVNKWFPDELINQYDLISNHDTYVSGPFSLYRNIQEVNELFMNGDWQPYMIHPNSNGWVESYYSRLVEISGIRYTYMSEQGNPWCKVLDLKKEDGKLYQDGIEIPLFHFRHFKQNGWPL